MYVLPFGATTSAARFGDHQGGRFRILFGPPPSLRPFPGATGPQVYLAESEPGDRVPPHVHLVDEFQVSLLGGGSIGNHLVAGVTVHYADAFSPYGPLLAGPAGLSFFTV